MTDILDEIDSLLEANPDTRIVELDLITETLFSGSAGFHQDTCPRGGGCTCKKDAIIKANVRIFDSWHSHPACDVMNAISEFRNGILDIDGTIAIISDCISVDHELYCDSLEFRGMERLSAAVAVVMEFERYCLDCLMVDQMPMNFDAWQFLAENPDFVEQPLEALWAPVRADVGSRSSLGV